jgi:hypothetical protein
MSCIENLTNLEVVRTDTKTFSINVTNNGNPVDISGYLLFFTVKANINDLDDNALISKTQVCPDDIISEAGIGYINLTSVDTTIPIANYTYDIKLQRNAGIEILWRKTILSGKFKVGLTATTRTS